MKQGLQEQIYKKYDYMFRDKSLPTTQTCMCWGIDTGDGWYELIKNLCKDISRILDMYPDLRQEFKVVQVKEKYGTLRFYASTTSDLIFDLIGWYEDKSATVCENCGNKGKLRGGGWLRTLCDKCENKRHGGV